MIALVYVEREGWTDIQRLRIILALVTIGCILGPIAVTLVVYHDNLAGMVITPQVKQLIHSGGDSSNNNSNNNNGNNPNSNNNGNGNGISNSYNTGNVNNDNPSVTNTPNSFGGSGQLDLTAANSQGQDSGVLDVNINSQFIQNGNNIQLTLDLYPTNVPNGLQTVFNSNNDYVFNFAGTANPGDNSGTQISASATGSLSGYPFSLNLAGSIDQSQDTLAFTLTSNQGSQLTINNPQQITMHPNNSNNSNNNNSNNGSNNNSGSPSPTNNNNGGGNLNPSFVNGQVDTKTMTITLTFSVTNTMNQAATVNAMGGTVAITDDQYALGTVSLQHAPVTIQGGQTVTLTVSGSLTQDGKNNLSQHYSSQTSLDAEVINGSMTVDGTANTQSGTQDIGTVSIIW